jgi:autotransporter-associated beta strand protein
MKKVLNETIGRIKPTLKLFKGLAAACLLLLGAHAHAQFSWPIYEPFGEYTNAYKLGSGESSNYWNFGNGTSSGQFLITNNLAGSTAAMSFPALRGDTNATPEGVQEVPSGSNASGDRGGIFPAQTGTWYTSFLLNYQDSGGMTEDRLAFDVVTGAASGSFTRAYTAIWLTPDYRLKVTKNYNAANNILTANFSAATPVLTRNVPHLIVMRYLKVPGGNDQVDLWVDPTPFGDDGAIPPATITTTNAPNIASFNGFLLQHRKVNGQAGNTFSVFQIDEIRFDSTWSGVTPPATPAPGPIYAVSGGGIGCPGDTFPINLSGSVATNDYWLFTNNVYAGTTLTGTSSALDFGSQSTIANYSILASNNVNGNLAWMSNHVSIFVRAPVTIVTEPNPVVTATNNRAQFSVAATGDQLSFQWYRDGVQLADDSHITGSTNNSLVIWPATTADLGNYYCIITNPCSVTPTATTTNALTLDAPNNLTWVGDGFNVDIWDVANPAYQEWQDASLVAAIFNGGDNVTFNDGYTFANAITLTNILTPTTLTVNATRNYTFGGTGTIAGSARLVKSGTGILTISNNVSGLFLGNPYSGGTVISNGNVFVKAWNALGSGPITLAGGTLETFLKGNGGTGLSNNVSVVANSTWQTDQSGQQAASLLGVLSGSSGTTLSISNSSATAGTNWIFFNAPSTNGLGFLISSVAVPSAQRIVFNNSSNNQIYNGPISESSPGVGEVGMAGTGSAYLNGTNTYTGPTTITAGLLAGTGSVMGPVLVTNGTIGAGSPTAIGSFTVNNTITFSGTGNTLIRVDKSQTQSNDLIIATGNITNAGTGSVMITNVGLTAIAVGDRFQVFSGAVSNGSALTVTGGGVTWSNSLAFDGSVVAVPTSTVAGYSTNITYGVSGNSITITWPSTHLGWILQSQTNAGIAPTNWFDVANTATVTNFSATVNPASPPTFFRLRHP